MRGLYIDIRSRIPEPPRWWDDDGVPRYDEFSPRDTPSIYATEAVLYRIECQQCRRPFDVAEDWSMGQVALLVRGPITEEVIEGTRLSRRVQDRRLDYGDPPHHGGDECPAGDTMSSLPIRVLQFWRKNAQMEWERVPELEGVDLGGSEDG